MFFVSKEGCPEDNRMTLVLTNCYQLLRKFANIFSTDLKSEDFI